MKLKARDKRALRSTRRTIEATIELLKHSVRVVETLDTTRTFSAEDQRVLVTFMVFNLLKRGELPTPERLRELWRDLELTETCMRRAQFRTAGKDLPHVWRTQALTVFTMASYFED